MTQINSDGSPARGTFFAAILVAADAVLVWATQPKRDPKWARTVLSETATELPSRYKPFRLRAINVPAALNRAREDLVTETLREWGRLALPELLAGVGLPALFTDGALKRLVDRGAVRRPGLKAAQGVQDAGTRQRGTRRERPARRAGRRGNR